MAVPESIRLKIERAEHHIGELEAAISRFHESSPYEIGREEKSQGQFTYTFHVRRYPPADFSPVIGDSVHCLRTALDHLMCELVKANGKRIGGGTEFPIFESRESYKAKSSGKVQGAHKDMVKLIDGLKPYKGGTDGFWQIHKLDIIDKHRTLITVYASLTGVTIDPTAIFRRVESVEWAKDIPPLPISLRPAVRCPLEDGDELVSGSPDVLGEEKDYPQFSVDIAIREPGVLECEPILPALRQLTDLVRSTVKVFDPFLS